MKILIAILGSFFYNLGFCLETPQMPPIDKHQLVKTLNHMGYMSTVTDPISERFLDFIKENKGSFLDVGTAYGEMTLKAMEMGASFGITNDIDEKQMQLVEQRIPRQFKDKITLMPGSFPDAISWPKHIREVDAILMLRVIHFMSGEQIEASLKLAFEKLKPEGKVFILVSAPYLWQMQKLSTQFQEGKKKGLKWPGFTTNMWELCPLMIPILGNTYHMLDLEVLFPEFLKAGFILEYFEELIISKDEKFNFNSKNGKESLGFVLRKPNKYGT